MTQLYKTVHNGQLDPNRAKPSVPAPDLPTEFEQQVRKLELAPEGYLTSRELRNWCQKNAGRRYVPENLLALWGIRLNENWGNVQPAEIP
jgi:hypothetical protein